MRASSRPPRAPFLRFLNRHLHLGTILAALLLLSGTASAQSGSTDAGIPDPEKWAKIDAATKEVVELDVQVKIESLTADVGAVLVLCQLESALLKPANENLDSVTVGDSYYYFHKSDFGVEGYLKDNLDDHEGHNTPGRPNVVFEKFEGDSINKKVRMDFARVSANVNMESWTSGSCYLLLKHAGKGERDHLPDACDRKRVPGHFMGNCIWPGTDPKTAIATFQRPGLKGSQFDQNQ